MTVPDTRTKNAMWLIKDGHKFFVAPPTKGLDLFPYSFVVGWLHGYLDQ